MVRLKVAGHVGKIKAGKFKPLTGYTPQRSAELPGVPTLAEAGVAAFEMSTWYRAFVTSGTPSGFVPKRQSKLARFIKLTDVKAKL